MISDEQYLPWNPIPNLQGEFLLKRLGDEGDGVLRIFFQNDTDRILQVDFRSALAYQVTGRAVEPESWSDHYVLSGNNGVFWKAGQSSWTVKKDLEHYVFTTSQEVIEVLTDEQPNIGWTNTLFGDAI